MITRVFAFIWGAILVTLIIFTAFISLVDLSPPEDIRREARARVVAQQLDAIAQRDGFDAALTHWQGIATVYSDVRVEADPSCQSGGADQPLSSCFSVSRISIDGGPLASLRPATLPLLIGTVVSAAMAILLSQILTRPIRAVSEGLRALAAGQLDTRLGGKLERSRGDLRKLGQDFDNAAGRLQSLTEKRTRLFHDISHEIRSPMARLRAAIGLIEVNPERSASLTGRMEADISRMDHLVNEILTLARLEQGDALGHSEPFDLLDLVGNIVEDADFEGRARNVRVVYAGPEAIGMVGVPELLHRACENVIRNAVAISPDNGTVRVTGARGPSGVTLRIEDEGPGVPEESLDDIFSPFIRGENRPIGPGFGLGLAIALKAIQAHGGTLSAQNTPGAGLAVTLALPEGASGKATPTGV